MILGSVFFKKRRSVRYFIEAMVADCSTSSGCSIWNRALYEL